MSPPDNRLVRTRYAVRTARRLAHKMNGEKQTGRIALRSAVAVATFLPMVVNAILIVLFEKGRLGRCDGIWIVGMSLKVSSILFLAALAGTGWMVFKRQHEPWWILVATVIIQMACLAFVVMPFVRR